MINLLKKHDFPLKIERLFIGSASDPYELIHFRESEPSEDGTTIKAPDHWSNEAVRAFIAEAGCPSAPETTRSIEENTVPSWLWTRGNENKDYSPETNLRQIFHRTAGAATYEGWKQGVFADEDEARAFFDEFQYALAQRFIVLEPRMLANAGLYWAYGLESKAEELATASSYTPFEAKDFTKKPALDKVEVRNASIDALLAGDEKTTGKWQSLLTASQKQGFITIRFADIAADWNGAVATARASLDLSAFRREDGGFDLDKLTHAVQLLAIYLELQGNGNHAIGFHNLAQLLMSLGIAYDSETGRATAAALAALITAEACSTSARLSALLGPSLDFAANRESVLRALRNHRRAVYGDHNDYEKVSVLPAPLALEPIADLPLVAAARHRWDEALELVRQQGLRATHFTELSTSIALNFVAESTTSGIAVLPSLMTARAIDGDLFQREIHPAVNEALFRLDYDADKRAAITDYIAGYHSFRNAPVLNYDVLADKGFTDDIIEKIEAYLPYANDIRLAFTPWIIGEDFCRDVLNISAAKLQDPRFDLLRELGFTEDKIAAANIYCYGHGTAKGAPGLKPDHANVLAVANQIPAEARIRMAASVQSFVSGSTNLTAILPGNLSPEKTGQLLLSAWRQGVKSVTIEFDMTVPAVSEKPKATIMARKDKKLSAPSHPYKPSQPSTLRGKPKARSKLISLKRGSADKPSRTTKP